MDRLSVCQHNRVHEPYRDPTANEIIMLFVEIVVKNLQRRWMRTLLTIAGIAVAVSAITTLWTIAWGYAASAETYYAARNVDIVVVRAGVSNRLTSSLQMDVVDRLRTLPGVQSVDGSLTEMVSVANGSLLGIPLRGFLTDGNSMSWLVIQSGLALESGETGAVLLGSGLAVSANKQPGQTIDIEGRKFSVAGIFAADNPFDANSIIAPLGDVQQLMGRGRIVSEFQVRAADSERNEKSLEQLCDAIESLQYEQHEPLGLKAQPTHQFVDTAVEAKLRASMAWATTAIVVALSLIGILNAMLMSVMERTRELGLLRAVGWRRSRVLRMILSESVVISVLGAIVGISTAWLLIVALRSWNDTRLLVPENLSGWATAFGVAAAIAAGIAGSLYPSIRAASIPPVEALRYGSRNR